MRILITGSNGMLAKDVIEKLKDENELILTDVDTLDITNLDEVIKFVEDNKPNVIINCAAYTAVDKAEENEELARKINALGPKNLAIASNNVGAILVHISTDYVFGGDLELEKEYSEDDEKEPVTVYGKTKLEGEENIKDNMSKYYIFRTAWLYGKNGNNFVKTMTKLASTRDELNVVDDQHGSPTYAKDLANILYEALKKQIPFGIYNATNIGNTTWYDFTNKILEKQNINCKVNPVSTQKYIQMMNITQAKRPYNSQLSKEKLLKHGIEIPNWEDGLDRYLKEED